MIDPVFMARKFWHIVWSDAKTVNMSCSIDYKPLGFLAETIGSTTRRGRKP